MNALKYEPLFSRLTWGNGTCAEFIGDKDVADELGAEMAKRWNNQEPDIHTRKAWAAIERQNAEIKALRDALKMAFDWSKEVPAPYREFPFIAAARAALGVQP